MSEKQIIKKAIWLLGCDVGRITRPCGVLFFIMGKKRSTKEPGFGQWKRNGVDVDFDFVEEACVASGNNLKELWSSIEHYHKLSKITTEELLQSLIQK